MMIVLSLERFSMLNIWALPKMAGAHGRILLVMRVLRHPPRRTAYLQNVTSIPFASSHLPLIGERQGGAMTSHFADKRFFQAGIDLAWCTRRGVPCEVYCTLSGVP